MIRAFFFCLAAVSLACCLPHISSASANSSAIEAGKAIDPPIMPSFTLSKPSPGALTLVQGQAGMATLSLKGNAAFYGDVKLTCSGATAGLQCLISPAATTLGVNQSTLVTVAVATQGAVANLSQNQATEAPPCHGPDSCWTSSTGYGYWRAALASWRKTSGYIGLASALLCWVGALRLRRGRGRALRMLILLAPVAGMGAFVTGCGSWRAPKPTATPLGVSTLTITAISGNISQTQRLTVSVTHEGLQRSGVVMPREAVGIGPREAGNLSGNE